MGMRVGKIVKEFVFKSLVDQGGRVELHGHKLALSARLLEAGGERLVLEPLEGDPSLFAAGEPVRVFFFFQNNYHTFESTLLESSPQRVLLKDPEGVYKNPQRKHERIRMVDPVEISFTLQGEKVELSFPRFEGFAPVEEPVVSEHYDARSIHKLVREFRLKLTRPVQANRIQMMRNRLPTRYEEKVLVATGKVLWIPSVEEDFPLRDPFPEERIVTKRDLVRFEETLHTPPHVIPSKLGNLLFEKQQKGIYSEVWCPVLFNEYLVGYIHLSNAEGRREKIGKPVVEFAWQFAQVLSHSLKANGYFTDKNTREQRYEARIIDISASGLLFVHPLERLARELTIHTDLDLNLQLGGRKMRIGSRVRRKFQDGGCSYFGVQYMRIDPPDFAFLFELLYGQPFRPEDGERWEGGAPPPVLDLFGGETGPGGGEKGSRGALFDP